MSVTQQDQRSDADFTLVIERILDAPRKRVWQAWTDHEMRMQWLSPAGFHVSEDKGHIRAGEAYKACMISPEGQESRYEGEYREIKEPEKLVFTHVWQNDICGIPDIVTVCTVVLEELEDGRTKIIFTQSGLSSAESRDSHDGGWSECFDKLVLFL